MRAASSTAGFGWPAGFASAFALAGAASLAFERARPWSEEGAWWGAGVVAAAALVATAPVLVGAALWTGDDEAVDVGRVHAGLFAALLALMGAKAGAAVDGMPDAFAPYAVLGLLLATLVTELALLNVAASRRGGPPAGTPFVFPALVLSLSAGFGLGALA